MPATQRSSGDVAAVEWPLDAPRKAPSCHRAQLCPPVADPRFRLRASGCHRPVARARTAPTTPSPQSLPGRRRQPTAASAGHSTDRPSRRSSPQTTPLQSEVAESVTITLPVHPLVGQSLPLVREVYDRDRRRFLDVEHPRGWILRVPAEWTDRGPPSVGPSAPIRGSVRGLRCLADQVAAATRSLDAARDSVSRPPDPPPGRMGVPRSSPASPVAAGLGDDVPGGPGCAGPAPGLPGPRDGAARPDGGGGTR